ncbi:Hypothetical predicted protein [Drosophila guanche]|uniref:Uncharacterized protein n=2 Tax=Drosophila guanche TaxID=7266 RepID=A0A3B0KJD3_DROGU|nr:Hypothetical predicted protein [Drosophila guanche]
MDGGSGSGSGSSTTTTPSATATASTMNCNIHQQQHHHRDEEYEYDEEEDQDEDEDDNDDDEYGLSRSAICRHCQRPQWEVVQRPVRQCRSRSKSTSKSRKRSKSSKRQQNHQRTRQHQHQHQHQQPRWPELNVANEQAIRFRCPQVGPLVGRDLHTPQPKHFHHPQLQLQVPKKSKRKSKHQQREGTQQTPRSPAQFPARVAAVGGAQVAQLPLPPLSVIVGGPEAGEGEEQQLPHTPDSPSLVTVSTWYTVAKQGVSC